MNPKDDLRKVLRKSRQSAASVEKWTPSDDALQQFRKLLAGRPVVAGYCAIGSEADMASLLQLAVGAGCIVALPCIATENTDITFRRWEPGDPLETARHGFRQPLSTALEQRPQVVLTPVLGFDRALNRIGQGAGHYDRAFAALPNAYRLGIAWAAQELGAIPRDPWDVSLDAVITEREWIGRPPPTSLQRN
jgi:5-formyltetrahydrofolate cyclo-ligase